GMAGFLLLLMLLFLQKGRWLAAGLAGAGLSATYPTAALIGPVVALWLVLRGRRVAPRTTIVRIALSSGIAMSGVLFVAVMQRAQTGVWDAYLQVQAHYHHRLVNPVSNLFNGVEPVFHTLLHVAA